MNTQKPNIGDIVGHNVELVSPHGSICGHIGVDNKWWWGKEITKYIEGHYIKTISFWRIKSLKESPIN